jgi:hypothetical protein
MTGCVVYLGELLQSSFGVLNAVNPFLGFGISSLQRVTEWLQPGI